MASGRLPEDRGRAGAAPAELSLIEQVVLLSLEGRRAKARHAAKIAARAYPDGPDGYHAALNAIQRQGLAHRERIARRVVADPTATRRKYARLVQKVIATATAPAGAEADLFVLLAAAGTLPVTAIADHLRARLRIIDLHSPLPTAVDALMDDIGLSTTRELADKLLPPHLFPLADHGSDTPISYGYAPFGWGPTFGGF